ncbi:CpsB/CapC family capsule biosynthesis tyrosine phosphatase [uncultured Clostridium sp.]|uniref:tyrosine-protein phosphatase n=1 Tax=uncultured Clostridium sp. TaxID=59620 RepID=UPI0025E1E971|nr:CpsB/CapC family capsule biosynthesis tyrosine phosphatase [uncultured Clostridium sp.]
MIDLHSHILPNVDDGSKDMNMSIEMIKEAIKCGTKKIVATPHYAKGYYTNEYNKIKEIFPEFKDKIEKELDVEIYHGQEVYFTENILEEFKMGNIGTINDSRYMLVEFPPMDFKVESLDYLYELQIRDIVPVVAHPERYRAVMKNPDMLNEFIEAGCLFQLNGTSLHGAFGKESQKASRILLNSGVYNFIGSDAHRSDKRTMNLTESIEIIKKSNKNYLDLMRESSELLLENKEVTYQGEKIKVKKGIFSFIGLK